MAKVGSVAELVSFVGRDLFLVGGRLGPTNVAIFYVINYLKYGLRKYIKVLLFWIIVKS